jgi:secreted trypsin-like serine protease
LRKSKIPHFKILAVLITLVAFTAFGLAGVAQAITNGQPDGSSHPYVGLIVFDDASGPAWRATGVLISPTVVLTAAHATDGAVAARVWFESDVTDPEYPFSGGTAIEAKEIITNPLFSLGSGPGLPGSDTHDIGIVILSKPVKKMPVYGELPTIGVLDALAMKTYVDQVGYGYQTMLRGGGPPVWYGAKVRYYAPAQIMTGNYVQSNEFIMATANSAKGKGGTCFGDSGGPVLLQGTNIILALTSYGANYECTSVSYSYRVDTVEAQNWIASNT